MKSFTPSELELPVIHGLLLGSVGPRPIAFASTLDKDGNRNLSPFSFFNVFSAKPPILIFSPARAGRTGATKNTYDNVKEVPEVVINVVTHSMVQQMSLSSSPYEKDVDEFVKAGFTPMDSECVGPARVAESPVQMECKVLEVKELGTNGGAGNLIICEVVRMHIAEEVLDQQGKVDQGKIDLVARMGGSVYCRAHGDALFEIAKPITTIGIGIDSLPHFIKNSKELSGNDLGQLGSLEALLMDEEIEDLAKNLGPFNILTVKNLLAENKVREALAMLMDKERKDV
jgi:flavin reductase (DIM6/NTAB) family NADH-FMN oxidoreductase RutF